MKRSHKIGLYIFTLLPILWTVLILIAAYTYFAKEYVVLAFLFTPVCYFLFLTPIYSSLLTYLKLKNKISKREVIFHLSLVAFGIASAWAAIHFDIFQVRSAFID